MKGFDPALLDRNESSWSAIVFGCCVVARSEATEPSNEPEAVLECFASLAIMEGFNVR